MLQMKPMQQMKPVDGSVLLVIMLGLLSRVSVASLLIQFLFSLQSHVDIIVEVAHPCIARDHGEAFLKAADFMVRSPDASRCMNNLPPTPVPTQFLDVGKHISFPCFGKNCLPAHCSGSCQPSFDASALQHFPSSNKYQTSNPHF